MPELPEVETVRSGLESELKDHPVIESVRLMRADIRFPVPPELPARLRGQRVLGVRRRAKYLLIDTPDAILLSHLGMTGSWRFEPTESAETDKHDHCFIELSDGRKLAFRDPRRFGMLDLVEPGQEKDHPRLKDLGPEPLDQTVFTGDYLHRISRKRRVAAKVFVMDQKIVVGVGNIYASEALFGARIRPTKLASRLSRNECDRFVEEIRRVLRAAIAAGGSSIRDYRSASGESGEFQASHRVYDRGGEACVVCGNPIRSKVIGGRSSFWCPKCQS